MYTILKPSTYFDGIRVVAWWGSERGKQDSRRLKSAGLGCVVSMSAGYHQYQVEALALWFRLGTLLIIRLIG